MVYTHICHLVTSPSFAGKKNQSVTGVESTPDSKQQQQQQQQQDFFKRRSPQGMIHWWWWSPVWWVWSYYASFMLSILEECALSSNTKVLFGGDLYGIDTKYIPQVQTNMSFFNILDISATNPVRDGLTRIFCTKKPIMQMNQTCYSAQGCPEDDIGWTPGIVSGCGCGCCCCCGGGGGCCGCGCGCTRCTACFTT